MNYKQEEKLDVGHMELTFILLILMKNQLITKDIMILIHKKKTIKTMISELKTLHIMIAISEKLVIMFKCSPLLDHQSQTKQPVELTKLNISHKEQKILLKS